MLGIRDRVKEAPWYNPNQRVTIGGVGSIGSWLSFMIGRIINTIYIYDFDKVEEHNLTGQLFGNAHIGLSKEEAVSNISKIYNPSTDIIFRGKFEENSGVTPITFACFDNMLARKHMFESWKSLDSKELYIDGRLTAEQFWVYAVTPDRIEKYENDFLPDDSEIPDLPCSFKSTTHISAMIASAMTVAFTNYTYNKKYGENILSLPFESKYIAPLNLYETI
jgi:hypothetical protein